METCAIMEREARKVQEKDYTGNRMDEVASRKAAATTCTLGNNFDQGTVPPGGTPDWEI